MKNMYGLYTIKGLLLKYYQLLCTRSGFLMQQKGRKYWNRTKLSSGKLSNISCYNYLKSNLKADVTEYTVHGCTYKTVSLFLVYWVFGKEDRKYIGLQVSSKHSSTHRLDWIMATNPDVVQTVQYFLLWNTPISTLELQRTWHLTGHRLSAR